MAKEKDADVEFSYPNLSRNYKNGVHGAGTSNRTQEMGDAHVSPPEGKAPFYSSIVITFDAAADKHFDPAKYPPAFAALEAHRRAQYAQQQKNARPRRKKKRSR